MHSTSRRDRSGTGSSPVQSEVVVARVREGESFAGRSSARGVFPDVAVKMAEVGESTGALQDMLNTVADFYDEEIATRHGALRDAARTDAV